MPVLPQGLSGGSGDKLDFMNLRNCQIERQRWAWDVVNTWASSRKWMLLQSSHHTESATNYGPAAATFYREQSAVIEHNNAILCYWCGTPTNSRTIKDQTRPGRHVHPEPEHYHNTMLTFMCHIVYEPSERILFDRHSTRNIPSSDKLDLMAVIFARRKRIFKRRTGIYRA